MESKTIAAAIVSNGVDDKTKVLAARQAFSDLINDLIKTNIAPIIAIADEAQAIDVANEIVNILITDDEIKVILDKYAPFWLKPLDGMIISKIRPIITGIILNTVHEQILDKVDKDWFTQVQTSAKNMQAGL